MAKKVPITRLGKFFGAEDYDLDVGMGSEWLEGDMNFTLVLYRVNRIKTKKLLNRTNTAYASPVKVVIELSNRKILHNITQLRVTRICFGLVR